MSFIRPVELKLARAELHARELTHSIEQWTIKNSINGRLELRDGRLGFRLVLDDFVEPPPLEEWGLITGDCVHNLRSALDNLAFALSRLERDPPSRPSEIAFPIHRDEQMFRARGRPKVTQMPSSAADLIERVQPFQRDGSPEQGTPELDALVLLQQLSNDDKHRVPPVAVLAPQTIAHQCTVEFLSDEDAEANVPPDQTVWADPLSPGVVLLEHRTTRPIASVKGSFNSQAIVAILSQRGPVAASTTVRDLGYYTCQVVALFRQFFA